MICHKINLPYDATYQMKVLICELNFIICSVSFSIDALVKMVAQFRPKWNFCYVEIVSSAQLIALVSAIDKV